MSRPKNILNRNKILLTAFRLFIKKGYNNISYQAIADESGFGKNLIQHYFPKKELFITDFLENHLNHTIKYLQEKSYFVNNQFVNVYLIGQIHFSLLTAYNKTSSFTIDIISNRSITNEIIILLENWGLEYLKITDKEYRTKFSNIIIMLLGGAYELFYSNLNKKQEFDIPQVLEIVILGYLNATQSINHLDNINLKDYTLSNQELKQANTSIIEQMEIDFQPTT